MYEAFSRQLGLPRTLGHRKPAIELDAGLTRIVLVS